MIHCGHMDFCVVEVCQVQDRCRTRACSSPQIEHPFDGVTADLTGVIEDGVGVCVCCGPPEGGVRGAHIGIAKIIMPDEFSLTGQPVRQVANSLSEFGRGCATFQKRGEALIIKERLEPGIQVHVVLRRSGDQVEFAHLAPEG